jgi:hypothetical protein
MGDDKIQDPLRTHSTVKMTLQFERKFSTQGSGAPCHVSFGFFSGFYGISLAKLQDTRSDRPWDPVLPAYLARVGFFQFWVSTAVDVPVKVERHFIPVDFVVLEMGEREKPPLILGRPFLKTVGATINVGKGGSSLTSMARGVLSSFDHARGMQYDQS